MEEKRQVLADRLSDWVRCTGMRRTHDLRVLILAAAMLVTWQRPLAADESGWVVVTSVADGDTIRIGRMRVRLIGVDAPEIAHRDKPGERYGPEAAAYARRTLLGQRVRLAFNAGDEVDAYGRVLAFVYLADGTFFNREIVRLGYARALTRFPFDYVEEFRDAEAAARTAQRGMWARSTSPAVSAGPIIANRLSKVYHRPGQQHYSDVAEHNRVYFENEAAAERMGYRPAKR